MRSSAVADQAFTPFFMTDALEQKLRDLIAAMADDTAKRSLSNILAKKDYNLLLRNAVNQQHIELVTFLLTKVPTVNVNSRGATSGQTALHIACMNGCLPLVKLLVENGAFVNAMDKQSLCPVVLAQQNDHFAVINYLFSCGGMRYITSVDANIPISLSGRSAEQCKEIMQAIAKLNECDARLHERPSIQNKFICTYLLKDNLATVRNMMALNQSSADNMSLPLLTFLRSHRIPLLDRKTLLALNMQYKDLPLDAMTALLADELVNDQSVVLPFLVSEFFTINELIALFTSEANQLAEHITLKVYTNDAAINIDRAPLLRWELCIANDVLTAEQVSAFAKKIGAALILAKGQKALSFSRVDQNLINELQAIATLLPDSRQSKNPGL